MTPAIFEVLRDTSRREGCVSWAVELTTWRNLELHLAAQNAGRSTRLSDYCLPIAEVTRHYGLKERDQALADSRRAGS